MSHESDNKITTSLHGRRFGLSRVSTGESGATYEGDFTAGTHGHRHIITTDNTTSANVASFGVQYLPGTSAGSSSVYTIDPPIPGVRVTIIGSTRADAYLKTNGGEYYESTQASSDTVLKVPSAGGAVELIGVTTGRFAAVTALTSASGFVTSTST